MPPRITIGITCFNAEDTIEQAVLSALQQNWPETEIIVVDDCSSDRSAKLLESLRQASPELRVVRHEKNRGYAAALNTIVAAAGGEFIAFFDDDDQSQPDRLSRQYDRIVRYEAATGAEDVFCYSNRSVIFFGETEPVTTALAIGRTPREPWGKPVCDFVLYLAEAAPFTWGQFGSCTLMARRTTLLGVGKFDENFRRCAEWDLAIRLALRGGHFIAVDESLVTQFITPGAEKSGSAPLQYALALKNKYKAYLGSMYWPAIAQTYSRYYYARGEMWKSRALTASACLMAPRTLLPKLLRQRANRRPGFVSHGR